MPTTIPFARQESDARSPALDIGIPILILWAVAMLLIAAATTVPDARPPESFDLMSTF